MAQAKRRYRHKNTDNPTRIRVRTKRLDQVDDTKLSLAYWLLAKSLASDKTDGRKLDETEVRKVADRIDEFGDDAAKPTGEAGSEQ